MRDDMQCPYCEAGQKVCHDDGHGYEEDQAHEHECSECGKTFVFYTSIHFYYSPQKADCLNGAKHRLKITNTVPREYSRMRCQDCGFERQLTDEELTEHGIEKARGRG